MWLSSSLIVTGVRSICSSDLRAATKPRSFCRSFLTRSRSRQPQRS